MSDIEGLIQSQGWTYRIRGDQFNLETCPVCQKDKYHFYIGQQSGAWDCKHCQEHGSVYELKQRLNIGSQITKAVKPTIHTRMLNGESLVKYHESLLKNEMALNYLKGRGLTDDTIKYFQLGYCKSHSPLDKQLKEYLIYPHCYQGQLVNVKYRSLPPAEKEFFSATGCQKVLFNIDAIKNEKTAFLCEGEVDTMTLWQQGHKNAAGLTLGTGTLKPEWFDDLAHLQKIIIVQDADDAGRKGAESIAKRLGIQRCWNLKLPESDDINSYFQKHTIEEFDAIEPQLFPVKNVVDFDGGIERLKEMRSSAKAAGVQMPANLPSLAKVVGALSNGDLVVLSGQPGVGKSTFALQIATDVALNRSGAALFYCLEMRPERLTMKVIQSYKELSEWQITNEIIDTAGLELSGLELYWGYNYSKVQLEEVLETITEAVARYEIKLVVFDNVHFLCTSLDNISAEVSRITKSLKLLAEGLEIPVMLVAHVRKLEKGRQIAQGDDLKDAKALYADADTVIILHRNRTKGQDEIDVYENETIVKLEKRRYGPCQQVSLYYHGARSRFYEMGQI